MRKYGSQNFSVFSTEGLFVMAVALTSHWNILTILAFLEFFIRNDIVILAFFETIELNCDCC